LPAAERGNTLDRVRLLTFLDGIRFPFNDGTYRRDPPRLACPTDRADID